MSFGSQLTKLRKRKNMTQIDLANLMDVKQYVVSSWEIGRSEPNISQIIKLSDIFCVPTDYLLDKNEHYPYSDEFIEKYQQNSGGYLDYAQQVGVVVDKTQHSPNQKWHFFQSWLYRSIEDGTLTYEADAKTRIYNGLLCPELLLWIYEAMGVNPNKVREAMHVAEEGKVNNTNVSTIAKNMRAVVSYDDVTASLVK